jgi:hypothetical protein
MISHGTRVIAFVCAVALSVGVVVGCSNDNINKTKRKMVEYLDGDYKITFYHCGENQTWLLKDSKVTSTPNGYYYFWIDGKYIQAPINQTVIVQQ